MILALVYVSTGLAVVASIAGVVMCLWLWKERGF